MPSLQAGYAKLHALAVDLYKYWSDEFSTGRALFKRLRQLSSFSIRDFQNEFNYYLLGQGDFGMELYDPKRIVLPSSYGI